MNCSQRVALTIVLVLAGGSARPAPAGDPARGRLLYEDHCIECHESVVHVRSDRKVHHPGELYYQIVRWARIQRLDWGPEEYQDVYRYLDTKFYHRRPQPGDHTMSFSIHSDAFQAGGSIPSRYTCDGEDISPPLQWGAPPPGTRSLVLIVDDPDAPDPRAPKMTWVHWVLYDIPPDARGLAEGISPSRLPQGTLEGLNDWKRTGYGGPCPPIGRHRYFFKLYALDTVLPDMGAPTKDALERAMQGHIIEQTELMGTYQR